MKNKSKVTFNFKRSKRTPKQKLEAMGIYNYNDIKNWKRLYSKARYQVKRLELKCIELDSIIESQNKRINYLEGNEKPTQ